MVVGARGEPAAKWFAVWSAFLRMRLRVVLRVVCKKEMMRALS